MSDVCGKHLAQLAASRHPAAWAQPFLDPRSRSQGAAAGRLMALAYMTAATRNMSMSRFSILSCPLQDRGLVVPPFACFEVALVESLRPGARSKT